MSAQPNPPQQAPIRLADGQPTADEILRSVVLQHAASKDHRENPAVKESRAVLNFPEEDLHFNLTCTTLTQPDMISGHPYVFADDEAGSVVVFYRLGKKLAGHKGIVHGGLPAVLLDEVMGRACFPRLPGKIAVTASLELKYKNPTYVESVIVIKASTRDIQGRKAWVDAVVEDAVDGRTLVEATALYIEPKWSAQMPKVL